MFQHSYQSGGYLEVFHTKTDKEKDKAYEKLYRVTNAAGFKKVYDKVTKGYIFELDGIRSSLSFPNNDKQDLGLIQPFLVLQVYLPQGSPFSVEVTITDTLKNKRRLHFSTGIRQLEKNYFHAKVPLDVVKRGVWMNLSFDLLSFFELFKGQTFRSIDAFTIGAVCKLRRIFTMRGPIADFSGEDELLNPLNETKMVPKTQNFTPGVSYANQMITLDLIKSQSGGLQPEESMIEEPSIPQGTKPKVVAPPTKQPLGPTNTKKESSLQTVKSPPLKSKAPVVAPKGVKLQENTERIETVARAGKENIRENTAPLFGQRKKVESIPQKKDFTGIINKPSTAINAVTEEFEDEKVWKNVPKPYNKVQQEKPKLTEKIPSQQEQQDTFSPEDDYEEQKHDFKTSFGASSRASTAKVLTSKNPWATYTSTDTQQISSRKIDPQENTASSSTMDTRKNLENTDPSTALEDTKASDVGQRQTTLEEDAEFSSIWRKIVSENPANVKSSGTWENAFEAKDLRKFSPLGEKEDADEAVRSVEEDREREEKEKERFGTMNWEFTKRNSTEEEDEIESVEEDLAFEVEEKIAMRDDREEFGNQWKRQEFKTKEIKEEKVKENVKENEGENSASKDKGNTGNTGKSVWESNQRRSLSEFEIKWKDHEHHREENSLVVQEDGSGEEKDLEDSLENMVNEYVKKLDEDEKVAGNIKKKNTKRTLSLLDDQVQDMMCRTRPYSPPFGQTLSDENKETMKSMKSSEGEDSDKAENKEEVEVVYDPVWKCYYDPKTNSYFELK